MSHRAGVGAEDEAVMEGVAAVVKVAKAVGAARAVEAAMAISEADRDDAVAVAVAVAGMGQVEVAFATMASMVAVRAVATGEAAIGRPEQSGSVDWAALADWHSEAPASSSRPMTHADATRCSGMHPPQAL